MKKKLLSTLLTVSMIAALAVGCGNSSSGEDSGDSQDSSSDGEQTTYEKIMEKGVMTVGTEGTYQPFTYHDENDELTGYDVEVAKAIGEKMGVEVEFSEITWEGLLASLDNGTVDLVLNQVGVTDEREEKYDFTDPYLYSYIALITTGDNTEIDSWESARGKKTSLNVSSNYAAIAEEYEMDITASETFSKDIELLTAGRTDCVINNTIAFNDYLVQKPDVDIKIVDVQEDADTVAIPIPKGNEDLVDAVNKAIKELQDDGTLTKLSEQFLGKDFSTRKNYSEGVASEIDHEVRRIIEEAYEETVKILTENMDKLERVAQALLEVETLDGEQFETLYTGKMSAEELAEQVREKEAEIQKLNEEEAAEYERIRKEEEEKLAAELAKYDTDYMDDGNSSDSEDDTESGEGKEAIGEDNSEEQSEGDNTARDGKEEEKEE